MTMRNLGIIACLLSLTTIGSEAVAQSSFNPMTFYSPQPSSQNEFGFRIASADLNNDSFADLLVSEPNADVLGLDRVGRAWIMFGPDMTKVSELRATPLVQGQQFGYGGFAIGEANDDANLDILVLSPQAESGGAQDVGSGLVLFGPDFVERLELPYLVPHPAVKFASSGLILGGDCPIADILVGAPQAATKIGTVVYAVAGQLAAFDLPLGSQIATVKTPAENTGYFGTTMTAADVDFDGVTDIAVSAPFVWTPTGVGIVYVMRPCGTKTSMVIAPPVTNPTLLDFGRSVVFGELTGLPGLDCLVGAPNTDVAGLDASGAFVLMSGPDFLDLIHTFISPVPSANGLYGYWSAVGDFSHDGIPDIALGDPYAKPASAQAARVYLYLGPDYTTILEVADPTKSFVEFGEGVTAADIDADGYDELICRSALFDSSGAVHVFDPINLTSGGSVISLSLGGDIAINVSLGPIHAGKEYLLAMGVSGSFPGVVPGPGSYVRLNPDAITGAGLQLLGTIALENFTGSLNSLGAASAVLHWPPGVGKSLAGKTLTIAAISIENGKPSAGSSSLELALIP